MAVFRNHSDNPVDYDRSIEDRRRHRQLVDRAIKDNLGDILSQESIVGEGGNKKIKIPIRGIKEYQFVYGKNSPGAAGGTGSEKRGDKVGSDKAQKGKGSQGAGSEEGEEVYETEINLEELMDYLMEDLELPFMDKKKFSEIITENSTKRVGYQRHGINPRLAKKRTVIEKIKRQQGKKRALREAGRIEKIERFPFKEEDLRYFRVKKDFKRESNAVIICVMDVSGSMDNTKKFLARSFYFVLSSFIRRKYSNVEIAFVSHTTTAKEVNEKDFFYRAESGGTYISSGLNKALEIIERRYNPGFWNIYTFYVSDGENWVEDDEKAVKAGTELCKICNMFGYAELMPGVYAGIKAKLVGAIKDKNFTAVTVNQKQDLWAALKIMLKKELYRG